MNAPVPPRDRPLILYDLNTKAATMGQAVYAAAQAKQEAEASAAPSEEVIDGAKPAAHLDSTPRVVQRESTGPTPSGDH